jgi:hypothetical protein
MARGSLRRPHLPHPLHPLHPRHPHQLALRQCLCQDNFFLKKIEGDLSQPKKTINASQNIQSKHQQTTDTTTQKCKTIPSLVYRSCLLSGYLRDVHRRGFISHGALSLLHLCIEAVKNTPNIYGCAFVIRPVCLDLMI